MKKKLLMFLTALSIIAGTNLTNTNQVQAQSNLTEDIEVEGSTGTNARGQYLMEGTTTIRNAGKGTVAAGGDTTAQKIVETIQVAVIVEQYNNGSWSQVYSWRETTHIQYLQVQAKYWMFQEAIITVPGESIPPTQI